ncbi:hypothetical protein ACFU8Q_17965 [Streptomyces sp. NPDC057543]|uniref:hypothetical protein n=1 Tax=Streptomyces sp. NPDC057543 TaxID=3346163 RepID=UPI00369075ED
MLLRPWGREAAELDVMLDGLIAAADPLIARWNPFPAADHTEAVATEHSRPPVDGAWPPERRVR